MKTYVILVSRTFPKEHKREGEETNFEDKINAALNNYEQFWQKLHTCRKSYELWAKRIKEVQEGKAVLSLRYWSGKPYRSKQVEFAVLDKDSRVGIQKLELDPFGLNFKIEDGEWNFDDGKTIAKNDGLSIDDFKDWFKNYDFSKPMAIIHFTKFRY